MKIIRPVVIDDTTLISSNATVAPAYDAGATYDTGDIVSSEGKDYESLADSNVGNALTDASKWLDMGADNKWRMFDPLLQSQTVEADEVDVVFSVPSRVDSIALMNLTGSSAQITVTDAVDGVVYDQTFALTSTDGIIDWYSYFFEPIVRRTDLVVTELPPYAGTDIEVVVSNAGSDAKVGALIAGQSRKIGEAVYGASVGIQDYSRKDRDAFGNATLVERAYSRRATYSIMLDSGLTDQVFNLLTQYRATPIVYVGSEDFAATITYGFFRDFNVEIAGPNHSVCSLDLEGLT